MTGRDYAERVISRRGFAGHDAPPHALERLTLAQILAAAYEDGKRDGDSTGFMRGLRDGANEVSSNSTVSDSCPKCGSKNYGPDGESMADACWDCGYVKED